MKNWSYVLLSWSVLLFSQGKVDLPNNEHQELLNKANDSVEEAAYAVRADPLRPIYHLQTKAYWINDPNGPVYFNNEYHMFFQHNPFADKWGNMSWGHAVSRDMVYWKHLPIVLTPNPESYDKDGVFSGCSVDDNGVMTIVYTGVNPEVQCIARSYDNGRSFYKYENNPVISQPPMENLEGFRDPFVWREKNEWYCVIGSGIKGKGGTVLLYRSQNLIEWEYMQPICCGFGHMWECPNFFQIENKWALIVSPYGECKYTLGDYSDFNFTHGEWHRMDFGGRAGFYAPNCLVDKNGRRILWGWIAGPGSEGYAWNGMLTLPRLVTLGKDNSLAFSPLPELRALRQNNFHQEDIYIQNKTQYVLPRFLSRSCEIIAVFHPAGTSSFGVDVLRSNDGSVKERILFDNVNLRVSSGESYGDFQLLDGEQFVTLHIFVDFSVIEVYINDRVCLTRRVYPISSEHQGISLFAEDRPVKVKSLDVWELGTIWEEK